MTLISVLQERSGSQCELCKSTNQPGVYAVPPNPTETPDTAILVCATCLDQIEHPERMDANHWRCLNDSMWSQEAPVQVMAWRLLHRLIAEGWPKDLLDMLYLDDDTLAWAQATGDHVSNDDKVIHRDSNGVVLSAGDTVTLIKDLTVKGANFTAKRGTAVRGISLVADNAEHIEGRVNGQQIVILTQFVKKS
ncbi:PhnA domain-containing protein [Saccharospirillum impatiens]|uniref:PhnA domain-containing protein n=1 Tax=Saccharospirillum impatiens TaxID=169438 RepID=UPI0003F91607|nr:alkylphosphonate utilization protein [Saccharospirillum impatiens]